MDTSEVEDDNPAASDELVAQKEVLDEADAAAVEAEEDFDGFDGSWDYEWVAVVDQIMEDWPWMWIASALFIAGLAYSYFKNKAD